MSWTKNEPDMIETTGSIILIALIDKRISEYQAQVRTCLSEDLQVKADFKKKIKSQIGFFFFFFFQDNSPKNFSKIEGIDKSNCKKFMRL